MTSESKVSYIAQAGVRRCGMALPPTIEISVKDLAGNLVDLPRPSKIGNVPKHAGVALTHEQFAVLKRQKTRAGIDSYQLRIFPDVGNRAHWSCRGAVKELLRRRVRQRRADGLLAPDGQRSSFEFSLDAVSQNAEKSEPRQTLQAANR